jgi:ferredoxin
MTIQLDSDLGIGSATRVNLVPGGFVLDEDEEIAEVADPHAASPEDIRRAARSCPTSAIIIQEDEE